MIHFSENIWWFQLHASVHQNVRGEIQFMTTPRMLLKFCMYPIKTNVYLCHQRFVVTATAVRTVGHDICLLSCCSVLKTECLKKEKN